LRAKDVLSLDAWRLLRVTSKFAMLSFGSDIWRRRRAAPRCSCYQFCIDVMM